MPTEREKIRCRDCEWKGHWAEQLTGKHPFTGDIVSGCPRCKRIDSFVGVCYEPGCWEPVCCGTTTPDGYRHTCEKHRPGREDRTP